MLKLRDYYINMCQVNLMNQMLVIILLKFLLFSGISAIKFLRLQMEKEPGWLCFIFRLRYNLCILSSCLLMVD